MSKDKNLELLNKLAKFLRAKELLETKKDLSLFERQVVEHLETAAKICFETLESIEELWEVYEDTGDQRKSVQVVMGEDIQKPSKAQPTPTRNSQDDGLALGVGLAVGGIFDYLKSPENVEKVEKSSKRQIEPISEEELEALENEDTGGFNQLIEEDELLELQRAAEELKDLKSELEQENLQDLVVQEEYAQFLAPEEELDFGINRAAEQEPSITQERVNLQNGLRNLTNFEQQELRSSLDQLGIADKVENYEEALEALTDFEGIF